MTLYLYETVTSTRSTLHHIVLPFENVTLSRYHSSELEEYWGHNPHGVSLLFKPDDEKHKVAWACNGQRIFDTEEFCKAHNLTPEETLILHLTYGEELPWLLEDVHPDHNPLLKYPIIKMEEYYHVK